MNIRVISIVLLTAAIVGIGFYKKSSSSQIDKPTICIYPANAPGAKEEVRLIRQELILRNIESKRVIEAPKSGYKGAAVKIFLDQQKFDECVNQEDASLKIGIGITDNSEDEDPKIITIYPEDKAELLFELLEATVRQPIACLLIYDEGCERSKQLAAQYQEHAKIRAINLRLCVLSSNKNVSSLLKEAENGVNAVIIIPGNTVFQDSELILGHFKNHKIPVFTNHAGLIRSGAFGGYDFDVQEIAHSIAEVSSNYLINESIVNSEVLDELYSQLHLNMDTIAHLGVQLDSDLVDEAVTVGGADL